MLAVSELQHKREVEQLQDELQREKVCLRVCVCVCVCVCLSMLHHRCKMDRFLSAPVRVGKYIYLSKA